MPDYANDILKAKKQAVDALNSHVNEMGDTAYDILLQAIEDAFDFKAGKIVTDKDFIKNLNRLTIAVLDLLNEAPKFTGPVSQFVRRMPTISDAITVFQSEVNGIAVPAFETAKKLVIDETIEQMLGNGLNQNFVQPLRSLIFQNATSGLSMKDIRKQLEEFISGGRDASGKLSQYVEQTAIQSADAYSGIINKKLIETFDYDALLITGSLIDNSSPQCRYAINVLNGKITRENWPTLKRIAEKHGLMDNTTFDNLPVQRLHWNCRHSFFPVVLKKSSKQAA